ncbi:MAG: spermidine synthase [Thermoanaerobaculia bacterium]
MHKRRGAAYPIIVREEGGERLLQFGRTLQSVMRLDGSGRGADYVDLFPLVRLFVSPLESVLFVGLGGGSAPRQFAAFDPALRIEVVEIDPAVVAVAREFFAFEEGANLEVHVGDGAAWVRDTAREYSAIVIDAYTAVRRRLVVPPELETAAFFRDCRARLGADGVLAFNCAARRGDRLTRRIAGALRSVFPSVVGIESRDGRNVVLFASAARLESNPRALRELARARLAAGQLPSARIAAGVLRVLPQPE